MIKKITFIFFLTFLSIGFSQEKSVDKLVAAPNPFSTATKITYTSKFPQNINLIVKNILGKIVYKEEFAAVQGKNTIAFKKNDLQTGIYFYQIQSSKNLISKRFVIK